MASTYIAAPDLQPRELWRLSLEDGHEAYALLGQTTDRVAVVWYLDGVFQEAAEFENLDDAERCAEDVRRMLTAHVGAY